jgi:ribosome-associated toxin RatA of RatAB toxin-antitoxin module
MGQLTMRATVDGMPAGEVYRRIVAFGDYPLLCDAVREVDVIEATDDHMVTKWEVNFHRGILRWTEHARFFPAERRVDFTDLDGDIDEFRGSWQVMDAGQETSVVFSVVFDIGIPTLEHVLDPIAEEALHKNVSSMLRGLLGDAVTIPPPAPAMPGHEQARTERAAGDSR